MLTIQNKMVPMNLRSKGRKGDHIARSVLVVYRKKIAEAVLSASKAVNIVK